MSNTNSRYPFMGRHDVSPDLVTNPRAAHELSVRSSCLADSTGSRFDRRTGVARAFSSVSLRQIAPLLALFALQFPAASQEAASIQQLEVWYVPATLPAPRFREHEVGAGPVAAALVDERVRALRLAYERDFEQQARSPFVHQMESIGVTVVHASAFAPVAVVQGDEAAITSLRALPGIAHIWPLRIHELEQDLSRQTVRADAVARLPASVGAVDGSGVRLCVLEDAVEQQNPYLPALQFMQPVTTVSRHATIVAGLMVSQHPQVRGLAPGATVLNANIPTLSTSDVLAGADWAVRQGAHCINASFGTDTGGQPMLLDHYFDHLSRHLLVNFIKGAGNQGSASGYVVSPGLGFNSITVGNSFDNKTPFWSDDVMNANSGYLDPVTGQPKPEIVAPATQLTALIEAAPWTGGTFGGGSFAGPQANAVAALLMQRNPQLRLWPEAVKATILAGAWHKIETPLVGVRDGVGQLNALASDAALRAGRVQFGNLTAASFDAQGNRDVVVVLQPFSETRAVLSWSSDPASTSPHLPNTLTMDLDLTVFDPSMQQVASSQDPNRSFEIARFVPAVGGSYTFRLHAARFTGVVEPFGLAVSQVLDSETAEITGPDRISLGTNPSFTLRDPYHAGHLYTAIASVSGGGYGVAFGYGNRSVPLVQDGLTSVSLMPGGGGLFTGYSGTLDANGSAQLGVTVPNLAFLLGIEVTQVGVVWHASLPTLVAVSPACSSRVVP